MAILATRAQMAGEELVRRIGSPCSRQRLVSMNSFCGSSMGNRIQAFLVKILCSLKKVRWIERGRFHRDKNVLLAKSRFGKRTWLLRFRCLDFSGKNDVKTCAARRVVGSPQAAAMRFNDGAADRQSHTGAMRLRRK